MKSFFFCVSQGMLSLTSDERESDELVTVRLLLSRHPSRVLQLIARTI